MSPPKSTAKRKAKKTTRKKARRRRARPDGPIPSQAALGREFGVSHQSVGKWLDHPDWLWGRGPWKRSDLPAIAEFVAQLQPDRSNPEGRERLAVVRRDRKSLLEETTRKIASQADDYELSFARKLGTVHDVNECERKHIAAAFEIKGRLLRIPNAIDRCSGLDDRQRDQLREEIIGEIDAALSEITRGAAGPFAVA